MCRRARLSGPVTGKPSQTSAGGPRLPQRTRPAPDDSARQLQGTIRSLPASRDSASVGRDSWSRGGDHVHGCAVGGLFHHDEGFQYQSGRPRFLRAMGIPLARGPRAERTGRCGEPAGSSHQRESSPPVLPGSESAGPTPRCFRYRQSGRRRSGRRTLSKPSPACEPMVYVPVFGPGSYALRTAGDPRAMAGFVRRALHE